MNKYHAKQGYKHPGIEVDPELHYIARYEDRSGNGQIIYLIRQCIREFEERQGPKIRRMEGDAMRLPFITQNPSAATAWLPFRFRP